MNEITDKKAVEDLISLFHIGEENIKSYNIWDEFYISPEEFDRGSVMKILHDYFSDKILVDKYCKMTKSFSIFITFKLIESEP